MQSSWVPVAEMDDTVITIRVGLEKQEFKVYKHLLVFYSPYFRSALTGPFKEARENAIDLKDTDASVMANVTTWFGTRTLPMHQAERAGDYAERVIKVYLFADMYDIPLLREESLQVLFDSYGPSGPFKSAIPPYKCVILAFDNLVEKAPLCRFLVDLYCLRYEDEPHIPADKAQLVKDVPQEFTEMMVARYAKLMKKVKKGDFNAADYLNICDYHEHPTEAEKRACPDFKPEGVRLTPFPSLTSPPAQYPGSRLPGGRSRGGDTGVRFADRLRPTVLVAAGPRASLLTPRQWPSQLDSGMSRLSMDNASDGETSEPEYSTF